MKIKKYISISLITLLLAGQVFNPTFVMAEEPTPTPESTAPTAPTAPTGPSAPTAPTGPSAPTAPTAPTAPEAPNAPTAPTAPEAPTAPSAPISPTAPSAPTAPTSPVTTHTAPLTSTSTNPYNGTSSSGNVGDTGITTGDASNNASIITIGNDNLSAGGTGGAGGATVSNSDNGTGSVNQGSASLVNNDNTAQTNSATVKNTLDQTTNTGGNDTSANVGNSSINTGDANTTGTVITSVNTNVDGVMISEFNIVDNHVGDILLDFGANCIAGCEANSLAVDNSGNGAYSYNDATSTSIDNDNLNQTNIADVGNDLTLAANSGYNDASFNTGGNSTITTGDANVSANAITFANNNIAGDVVYAVVNIFGDLVGDIILTEEMMNFICGGSCTESVAVGNTENGANSTNIANATNTTNENVFQNNDADITNTLVLDATTGDNDANFNTGGNNSINTGSASIDANVLNIANMNLIGGNMWLVIVNEAGNWIGKIYGGTGGNVAASALMSFLIDPFTGAVTATNSDNGTGSVNQANTSSTSNNTINQNNTATINNTLNLTANTGGNSTSFNTGGDSSITTGDANIVANIVNFVNNNIVGDGKLVITVVNVFGSWLGDFLTPGSQKDVKALAQNADSVKTAATNTSSDKSTNESSKSTSAKSSASTPNAAVVLAGNAVTTGLSELRGLINNMTNSNVANAAVEEEETMVAGIAKVSGETAQKLSINLAWLMLLLPLAIGAGAIITRKVYLKRTA